MKFKPAPMRRDTACRHMALRLPHLNPEAKLLQGESIAATARRRQQANI
jgi:hypothetical protein